MRLRWAIHRFRDRFIGLWLFHPAMIAAAISGSFVGHGFFEIIDTWQHRGPGVVHRGPDFVPVSESEKEYKSEKYGGATVILSIGLIVWACVTRYQSRQDLRQAVLYKALGQRAIDAEIAYKKLREQQYSEWAAAAVFRAKLGLALGPPQTMSELDREAEAAIRIRKAEYAKSYDAAVSAGKSPREAHGIGLSVNGTDDIRELADSAEQLRELEWLEKRKLRSESRKSFFQGLGGDS